MDIVSDSKITNSCIENSDSDSDITEFEYDELDEKFENIIEENNNISDDIDINYAAPLFIKNLKKN